MIYDLFSYNGEADMLELRFQLLSPFVHRFVMVEGMETFSGNPKPLYWVERNRDRFEEWEDKIQYFIVDKPTDQRIMAQLADRLDYVDEVPFQRAFYQKERLRTALSELEPKDEDIVIYGDIDEVPSLELLKKLKYGP